MKIVHIVENLNQGGLERMVIDLASIQILDGNDVTIITIYERGLLAVEAESLNISVLDCAKSDTNIFKALQKLSFYLKQHNFCIIHSHNAVTNFFTSFILQFQHFMSGYVLINTRHAMPNNAHTGKVNFLYKMSLKNTAKVVFVSKAALSAFVSIRMANPQRSCVIHNGINEDHFKAIDTKKISIRNELGLPVNSKLIIMVGRLSQAKDHKTLLNAFKLLLNESHNCKLILVGDGSLREELIALTLQLQISTNVYFLGNRNDVPSLLLQSDIFVLSTNTEGYSMALLEAAYSGLILIATRVGGNSELLQEGKLGFLVDHASIIDLKNSMKNALKSDAEVRSMKTLSQNWARNFGTIRKMNEDYKSIYIEEVSKNEQR